MTRNSRKRFQICARNPATPVGIKYMKAIRNDPYTAQVAALEI